MIIVFSDPGNHSESSYPWHGNKAKIPGGGGGGKDSLMKMTLVLVRNIEKNS